MTLTTDISYILLMFYRYIPLQRAKIGKYASLHGVAAAARVFTRKFHSTISQSTVRSIRDAYRLELKRRRRSQDSEIVAKLPEKKRGRKLLIGEHLDRKVQLYLTKLREGGGAITTRIVMATIRGLLLEVCWLSMEVMYILTDIGLRHY